MQIVIKLCNEGATEFNFSKNHLPVLFEEKRLGLEVRSKWSEIKRKGVPHTVFQQFFSLLGIEGIYKCWKQTS